MKKIILIFLLASLTISAQTKELTLQESLTIGLKNSKELKIAKSKIAKAKAMKGEIYSSMFPKISFNAAYRRLSDVHPFQLKLPMFPGPVTIQETILDNYSLSATVEQPIFTGFKLSSLNSAAAFNSQAEKVLFNKTNIEKVFEIKKAFWHLFVSEKVVELVKANLSSLKNHLRDTENFLINGLVTKNDYLKLKVEISNIKYKLLDAKNNYRLARTMFNKVIGYPLNKKIKIVTGQIEIDSSMTSYSELLKKAMNSRAEIKSTSLRIKALEKKRQASQSGYYPQLFAFGNYYYSKPNQRFLPVENKFNDSWDVGVALKWNLWSWGGTSAKVEQTEQDLIQAKESLSLLKEGIELDVYNNYLKLQSAIEKINLSKIQIKSAEENYRITKEKYKQQLATSTELIDAESSLLKAKTIFENSKAEYLIRKAELEKAVGKE